MLHCRILFNMGNGSGGKDYGWEEAAFTSFRLQHPSSPYSRRHIPTGQGQEIESQGAVRTTVCWNELGERKGGQTAVETAQLLNDAGIATTLRVVGKPPQGQFPDFVEFLGVINKNSNEGLERLVDLYRSADFFILPTKAEAAGIVFSEASSFGLPSLTSPTGGVPDYVKNGVNGECFAPGTPASQFAESIKRMLLNADEYEALSAKAFLEYRNG